MYVHCAVIKKKDETFELSHLKFLFFLLFIFRFLLCPSNNGNGTRMLHHAYLIVCEKKIGKKRNENIPEMYFCSVKYWIGKKLTVDKTRKKVEKILFCMQMQNVAHQKLIGNAGLLTLIKTAEFFKLRIFAALLFRFALCRTCVWFFFFYKVMNYAEKIWWMFRSKKR